MTPEALRAQQDAALKAHWDAYQRPPTPYTAEDEAREEALYGDDFGGADGDEAGLDATIVQHEERRILGLGRENWG